MKVFSRREGIFLLLLFLFALGLRLIYLAQLRDSPLFDAPIMDAKYHDQWAWAIRAGQPFQEGPYFRAPLYAYFLAAIYALFGHSYLAARMVQFLIGSLSVLLIYVLGKRTFGPTVGRVAAVLASVYGLFIYFEGELLIPVLIVFLDLALILAVLSTQQKPGWWRWLGCGAILGLSAIARPNVLLFGMVLFPWLVVRLRRQGLGVGKALVQVSGVLLGAVLVILPVTVRNYVVGRDVVPIASQGGVNFFIGNNRDADGITPTLPGTARIWWTTYFDAATLAEQAEGRSLKASEVSDYWLKKGLEFVRDEPGAFLRLLLRKLGLFWYGQEISNNKDIYFFSQKTPPLGFLLWQRVIFCPFGIVAPLALAGMVLAWRRREGRGGLLALFVFSYMVSVILFFVNARFRLPVIPFLLPFAAYSLVSVFGKKRLLEMVFPLILLLLFTLAINRYPTGYRPPHLASSYNILGNAHLREKRYQQAEAEYQRSLSVDPPPTEYIRAINGLARVYSQTDRVDKAIELLEKAISRWPKGEGLHFQLGLAYYAKGRLDDAIGQWQETVRLYPTYTQAQIHLGNALEEKGLYKEAITFFEHIVQFHPELGSVHYSLGNLYKRLGRIDQAMKHYQEAIESGPNIAAPYHRLALLYSQTGVHLEEGIELAKKALELDKSVEAWETLAELYIKKGEVDKARDIFWKLGEAYLKEELYDQAKAEYQRALSIAPHHVPSVAGMACVYQAIDNADKAIEQWERAVSLKQDLAYLRLQLGLAYYAKERLNDAIAQWKEAAQLQPESPQPYFQLGNAYEKKGQYEEAIASFRQAIQVSPQNVAAYYNLGHLYKRLGWVDEAVKQFKRAVEINPNFGDAYNSLAWLYAQEGVNLDEGIRLIKKALELNESDGAYWDTLAELYIKKGQGEKAREIFQKMILREPDRAFWKERLRELSE